MAEYHEALGNFNMAADRLRMAKVRIAKAGFKDIRTQRLSSGSQCLLCDAHIGDEPAHICPELK
ncbi:hypothetical protein D3C72_2295330 [compost metagenome]